MAAAKNREGTTYRHRATDAIVLCVKSRHMSFGTSRHTIVVIDCANSNRYKDGQQVEVDETPMEPWERHWEPL